MKIGHSVDIFILRDGYNYRLGSKIEEVQTGVIYISLITSKGRVFHFKNTDEIEVVYKTENRLFKWKNVRGGIGSLEGDVLHCLYMTGDGKPYNRRNSFRVLLEETAVVDHYVLKEDAPPLEEGERDLLPEEDERYELKHFTAFVKDLSESGIGIYTNEKLEKGDEISVELFTTLGKMKFTADVQRITKERKDAFWMFYGCIFTKSDKNLPKYLYDLQRIQLKKKKGRL